MGRQPKRSVGEAGAAVVICVSRREEVSRTLRGVKPCLVTSQLSNQTGVLNGHPKLPLNLLRS